MKRLLIIILILFTPVVRALNDFEIDPNKINITDKGNYLVSGLSKEYDIDITGYTSTERVDEEAKEYTKKIINILFSNEDRDTRRSLMLDEQLISSSNGFDTLTSLAMIDLFLSEIDSLNINFEYVKLIRTIENKEGTITVSYFPNAVVDDQEQDFVLMLFLKKEQGQYKVFMPWYSKGESLEEYFNNLGKAEDNDEELGGTYRSLSLGDNTIDEESLKSLYDSRLGSNVTISALSDGGTNKYGNGFYLRKGLIVTTWSLFLEILNNSDFIYVTDSEKNSYNIEGIVTANVEYDVVVLKINEEVGNPVVLTNDIVNTDDLVFSIVSQNNNNFIIKYGKNITNYNGKYKNLFPIKETDVGSALYNKDGNVIGFNTNNSLNNDVSIANSTSYLISLQSMFFDKSFQDIKATSFEDFKNRYYNKLNEERIINNIEKKVWKKYKNIGNIEGNLNLKLLKAYYTDNIISLRYKNEIAKSIDSMLLLSSYEEELVREGYIITCNKDTKKVYEKDNSIVVIKENLDYIIIVMMER